MPLPLLFAAAVCQVGVASPKATADTLSVAQLRNPPTLDGSVSEREYGAPSLHLTTAAGDVRIWVGRHADHVYVAAVLPDSSFYWGDDLVVSLDPMGRNDTRPNVGDRQWYLRRVLDSSVVMSAVEGSWFIRGQLPSTIGATRHHAEWDVASSSSAAQWMVELRVRLNVVKPDSMLPRISFRTFNDKPQGWWSWPAPPQGVRAQAVEQRPELWVPLRIP
jgi:hypothetical protein